MDGKLSLHEKISIRGVLERYRVPMQYKSVLQTKREAVYVLSRVIAAPAAEYWRYMRSNMPSYFKARDRAHPLFSADALKLRAMSQARMKS